MALVKFDIPMRHRRCVLGDEGFSQGMEYYSVLEDAEGEGFQRKDYCVSCWEKLLEDSEHNSFGKVHWKSCVPIRKQDSQSNVRRDERAMELLKEILQNGEEEEAPEAFVLALLLARNKILQLKQEIKEDDGRTILLYEETTTEEMLGVSKVDLSQIQTEKIQRILAYKLNMSQEEESEVSGEVDDSGKKSDAVEE